MTENRMMKKIVSSVRERDGPQTERRKMDNQIKMFQFEMNTPVSASPYGRTDTHQASVVLQQTASGRRTVCPVVESVNEVNPFFPNELKEMKGNFLRLSVWRRR